MAPGGFPGAFFIGDVALNLQQNWLSPANCFIPTKGTDTIFWTFYQNRGAKR